MSDEIRDSESEPDFAASAREARSGLLAEFKDFLLENKKWWLAPIVVSVLLLGGLVLLGGTAAAPFIYTLF
ncbi:MAG: DUF5989 family protein [Myxococcota bacterium]